MKRKKHTAVAIRAWEMLLRTENPASVTDALTHVRQKAKVDWNEARRIIHRAAHTEALDARPGEAVHPHDQIVTAYIENEEFYDARIHAEDQLNVPARSAWARRVLRALDVFNELYDSDDFS